jgi:Uma2 family endonuclease
MDTFVLRGEVTASWTDDEFLRFCLDNPDLRIERNSNLEVIIMSPVSTFGGFQSGEVFAQLADWNRQQHRGIVFDSSAGFTLPDKSVLSPDASWLSTEKWKNIDEDEKNRFARVCPDFVIEVRSKSDSLNGLKNKMQSWLKNGVALAWLIDPLENTSYIFKPNQPEETIKGFKKKITGEGPVAGFVLDLSTLKI